MYDEAIVREVVDEWYQVREIVLEKAPEELKDAHALIKEITTHINMTMLKKKRSVPQSYTPRSTTKPTQSSIEQQEELIALIMSAEEAHKNPQSMVEHAIKTYNVSGIDQFNTTQADSLIKTLRKLMVE